MAQKYSNFYESHINGVKADPNCDYLFCLRNPISRAFSAFEWRKKLVLSDKCPDQVSRFPGEVDVLRSYGSLGFMARSLYRSDGSLNQIVARDFNLIHHLRESISFYIDPLLSVLTPRNVLGVICQETLSVDCSKILLVDCPQVFLRRNDLKMSIKDDFDPIAKSNLQRFLHSDYRSIASLWSLWVISSEQFKGLMNCC